MSGAPLLGGKPKRPSAKQVKMRTKKLFSKLRSSVNVASIAAATKGHHPRGSAASAVAAAAVPAASGLEERKTTAPVVVPPYRHHAEIQSLDHDPTAHVLSCPEHGFSDGESGDESDTDGDDTSTMRLSRARYFRAAFLLMHGQTGRSMHGHCFDEEALSTYLLVHSSYWIGTYGLIGVLHMSLGLMNANDPFSWGSGSFGIGLEAVVIFVYVLDTWLVSRLASNHSSNSSSIRSSSSSNHSDNNNDGSLGTTHDSSPDTGRDPSTSTTPNLVTSHWNQLRALLILFFGTDLLMFVCTSHQTYRVSTCLRPLMIVLRRREFRHMMRAVFVSAARIVRVLTLMGFHIVFFGFVAFVFFSTVDAEHTKFGTLSGSILEMLLIVTSPGAVLAAMGSVYAASGGWGALFFVIFVIIGNMVIYKVVLATAYRSFKSFMKRELLRKMRNRRICHAEAFELLTNDGTITAKVWRRLFLQMQEQQSFHWLWLKDHHGQGCCWGVFQCCTCWRVRDREGAEEKRVKQAHRRAMRKSRAISKLRGQDHENATTISQGPELSPSAVTAYSPRDSNVHSMLLHYRLAANAIFSEIDFDNSGLIEQAEFDRGIALAQQASVEINREQTGRTHNNQSPQSEQAMSVTVLQKLKARLEHGRKWLRHVFEFDVLSCPCFQTLQVEHGARASTLDPGRSMAVSSKRMDQKPAHHHSFPVADLLIDLVVILSCVSIYFDTEHRIVQAATTAAVPHNSSGMIAFDSGGSAQVVGQGNIGGSTSASPEYVIWRVIGTITMVLFFAEVCLRVFAFGLREYLIMPMHKLDIFCVATGLLFFIVTWLDTSISANGNPLYNLFLVLRASRMIRLLWFIPALRGMLWTVGKLVPSLLELLSILFVPMYMGASIGHIFLGECLVYPIKNPAINVTAPATAKLLAKWLPIGGMLQFDTPGRAMLDMFEMANIASWNIVMDAGSALCGPRWASPLYFFTVRIVLHMVFIPIIVGFIIEQFVKKYEWWEHHEDATDRDTRKRTEGKGGGSSGDNDSLFTVDPLVEGKGEEGLEGEHPEQNTTRERTGSLAPKDHKVLISQPLNDGLRSIYVSVRKENPSMEGAPSEDTDIFNVSADIAAEQAAEQAAENIALQERVQFLETTVTNSHASLAEARKKERKMQRQIETLKSELKKRMASVKN